MSSIKGVKKGASRAALPGQTDNLADLENLNNETLLNELKVRFNRDGMYTYVGEILVAVNPFKTIAGIYDPEKMRTYTSVGDKKLLPPHIFATSDIAFNQMKISGSDQVCVISGESGAGKTESAKLFVKQLVMVSSGAEFQGLEQKLLDVNPVLEAFGNAKTVYNNNSSRFGKFISVKFTQEGKIRGAVMTDYLLEKSRVIGQGAREQNFHIFYLLFTGMQDDARYALGDCSDYRFTCTNTTASSSTSNKHFQEMYKELVDGFETVGFSTEELDDLYHLMSGIMHLGELEFDGEDEAALCSDSALLTTMCDQLGLDENAVELALTRKVLVVHGEETETKLKLEQSEDVRDAAAKAIYSKAFSWLVQACNAKLGADNIVKKLTGDTSMGILDIFGFECFETNSFEQMCINLTNEQLQWYFNEHIFAQELSEYAKEGVDGTTITYKTNEPLLDMLLLNKPKLGLLGILNEESNFPKATDSTMILKFHNAFTANKEEYGRPRGNEEIFTLHHYAGAVTYQAYSFLEKNRDTLAVDVVGALRLSQNALIKELFGGEDGGGGKGKGGGRKPKGARNKMDRATAGGKMRQSIKHARASLAKKTKTTVAKAFADSLNELMEVLKQSQPHFIRCIKPNHSKQPNDFDDELIEKQLSYTGMLETTRIRREGYSSRPLFGDFVARYKILGFPCRADVRPTADSCRQICDKAGVEGFAVGKTKVFLRYFHADQLNGLLEPYTGAATMMSKYCRGFSARAKFGELLAKKREQEEMVRKFCNDMERNAEGVLNVFQSLIDEDDKRPADFFTKKEVAVAPPSLKERGYKNKSGRKGGMARAASVKWFKEVESKKGSGIGDDGGFASWFHGIITRLDAEALLRGRTSGTFLIRVAESRFGYSLSLLFKGRCKHFMIDQDADQRYLVVGNDRTFPSLNEVVAFHQKNPVTDDGDLLTASCPTDGPRDDLAELQ